MLQVAVFDDAVSDPAGALVGMATVPLDMLAEGRAVEGWFHIINPTTGQSAGSIHVSVTWRNPLSTDGVRTLSPRAPMVDRHLRAAAAAPAETAAVDVQQQQHVPVATVPLLPAARDATPSTSAAAAAAVAAALQSKQQLEVRLLRSNQTSSPAAAFAGAHSKTPGGMLLLAGQQLASNAAFRPVVHRYSSNAMHHCQELGTDMSSVSQAILLPLSAAGQSRPQQDSQQPIMQRVDPDPSSWRNLDTTVYFKVDSLSLSTDALRDPALQHLLLAHMFCEDFTSAAQQCTGTVLKGPGHLRFSYAVAYSVADPISKTPTAAGIALAEALAAAENGEAPHMVLPVLLASSQTPVVADFSQGQ
eukprot:GHUV01046014.1.p1 GENE.GHUV01046014.1~~GHUV01046014.1.p1  ORF type:complete len:360 (+),score=128.73 GHUV01046014.1:301-1380(+)